MKLLVAVVLGLLGGCHNIDAVRPPITGPGGPSDAGRSTDSESAHPDTGAAAVGDPPPLPYATHCPAGGSPAGWACIEPGTFMMGSPTDESMRENDETLHQVTITSAFFMKTTEVTQAEWQALTGSNPSYFHGCGGDCPVEQITWFQMIAYANALSAKEGLTLCYAGSQERPYDTAAAMALDTPVWTLGLGCAGYRLPTEAEWEYAARAGTSTAFYTGSIMDTACSPKDPALDQCGWYCGNASSSTHPAAQKVPNAWGLYDMLGNVWEPVWDWYALYDGPATDPTGPSAGSNRVIRGGALDLSAYLLRVAHRDFDAPSDAIGPLDFDWPVPFADANTPRTSLRGHSRPPSTASVVRRSRSI